MTTFVPLLAGTAPAATLSASPTRLKPIAADPKPFQPASGNTAHFRNPKADSVPSPAPPAHVQHGPPKVTLEKQGDTITHIRIECGCGQVTELKCEY
jgi:hypothetical protein